MPGNETPKRTWRIAFLRRRFSPTGGAEHYLLRLATGLASHGHQLTLYCEDWSPRENPFQEVRKIDSHDPASFARKVMLQSMRDRHDIVFSLERVPNCDLYRAGDGLHADWLAYRQAFHPVMGRIRTLLRPKNRQLCRLEAQVFAPGGVRRVICNSRFVADQITKRFDFPPGQIDVIYNGVPYQQFSMGDRALGRRALQLSPDDYVVLLVGAGAERKGHAIARDAIMRDPAWQGGHYYGTGRAPDAGMGLARMVGHMTYLSAEALRDKFGRRLQFGDDIRYTITEPEFEIESYLDHQAGSFVKRFDANTYLYTSRALTYFDLARQHGGGSLARALQGVSARELLIAFSSDWLYPPAASRDIEEALLALGKPVECHVIEAPYGHDCFLLEEAQQTPYIRRFLADAGAGE